MHPSRKIALALGFLLSAPPSAIAEQNDKNNQSAHLPCNGGVGSKERILGSDDMKLEEGYVVIVIDGRSHRFRMLENAILVVRKFESHNKTIVEKSRNHKNISFDYESAKIISLDSAHVIKKELNGEALCYVDLTLSIPYSFTTKSGKRMSDVYVGPVGIRNTKTASRPAQR